MVSVMETLRGLEAAVPEGAGEVVASLVIVAVILGVRYGARQWRRGSEARELSRVRLGVSGVVAVVTGVGVVLLIGVWGLLGPLFESFRTLGLTDLGGEFVLAAVLLGAAYTLTSFVGRVIEVVTESQGRVSQHQREILYRLTQVVLYTIVGLTIISLFTRDLSSLLLGAGFLGIVVGMAARQTLGAVLAGFVLMFSRPFEVGDWVEIGENEGIVTQITIVNTRIQTFDGEYVMLPNDTVSGSAIVNRTRKGRLRVEVEVGVDYEDDPRRAAELAEDAVSGLEEVLRVPTPQVVLKRFADSSVVLGVRVWIDNPSARRKWRARTAVIDAVKGAFAAEGITIPFPQRTVSGRTAEGDIPLTEGPRAGAQEGRGDVEATADGGADREDRS